MPATAQRPSRGDVLELTIDSLAHGGNGVARLEGYVVFVAGALPGDRVRAVVGKSKKAYAEARAIEIVQPAPDRVPPFADHPGAPWQELPYERQLAVKAEQVEDALRRIGRLDGFELEPIVPAVEQWRYRNKLEYSFGTGDDGELVPRPGAGTRSSRCRTASSRPRAATSCASRCWRSAVRRG
jgi:23S rRNA (uracil1939-C5)-methyltransferase